jgi:hypothetical protein
MSKQNIFIPLTKVDEEKRLVFGLVAGQVRDKSGEIMHYGLSKPNFVTWSGAMEKASNGQSVGNLRAMHKSVAAGKITSLTFDDENQRIECCGKVVDDAEWNKVLEGVYTGFSVGGDYGKRWKDPKDPGTTWYVAVPNEISLVDNPCITQATFEVVKSDGTKELRKFHQPTEAERLETRARELCKAAGHDPDEQVAPEKKLDDKLVPAVLKWHGFIENARREATADQNDLGLVQKWVAPDGTAFEKKDEARAHVLAKGAEAAFKPVTDVLDAIDNALTAREGAAEAELTEADLTKISKSTGLTGDSLQKFMATASHDVIAVILAKKEFTDKERGKLADAGKALPDGSFPIENVADLKNAVKAYGRAKDKPKAKAHIIARAKSLKATAELPEDWDGSTADKAAKTVTTGLLRKGMRTVARLAGLLEELNWLREEVLMEQKMEGDNSTLPSELAEDIANLCKTLCSMTEEETGELVTRGLDPDDVCEMEDMLAACHSTGALRKFLGDRPALAKIATGVEKAAARHDKETADHIQAAHDHVAAACDGETCDGGGEADKAVAGGRDKQRLSKAHGLMKELGADCGAGMNKRAPAGDGQVSLALAENVQLRKLAGEMKDRLASVLDRVEKLEAQPAPSKGHLGRGLTKNQDNGGLGGGTGDGDATDQLAKILESMTPEERSMALMKAAMRNGRVLAK